MEKQYKLVDNIQPIAGCSKQVTSFPVNWQLCILCQTCTNEPVQCPAKSKRSDIGAGYKYVSEQIKEFTDLDEFPFKLDVAELDIDPGIEATLEKNGVSWHRSCRNKISKEKLDRVKKRKQEKENEPLSPVKTRKMRYNTDTATNTDTNAKRDVCIFCDEEGGASVLHSSSTLDLDFKVRKAAIDTKNTMLLSKLACGDMVAIKAKYHNKCLAKLYRQAAPSHKNEENDSNLHGIAFAELVAYVDACRESDKAPVFNTADLRKIYSIRLEELGAKSAQVHSTRLKDRLLAAFPDMKSYPQGRDVLLAFDKDVGEAIISACKRDFDSDALCLLRAAEIVRREIFEMDQNFNGTFADDCQEKSVPASLLALMRMVIDGPSLKPRESQDRPTSTASLTLAQLVAFNAVKKRKSNSSPKHMTERETPVPIYLALKIHSETRKRTLVDTLHRMGLCVSYSRLLNISNDVTNTVCALYATEGIVCPPTLSSGVFTTAVVDNIDHNPSSTTSTDSFHGTGISLMQHPGNLNSGISRNITAINENVQHRAYIMPLPEHYTLVPPASLTTLAPSVPQVPYLVQVMDIQPSNVLEDDLR